VQVKTGKAPQLERTSARTRFASRCLWPLSASWFEFAVTGQLRPDLSRNPRQCRVENHFVHAAAGIDQRGRDDGERAALLDVARGAEEAFRPLAASFNPLIEDRP
jgi:hypothetical protein